MKMIHASTMIRNGCCCSIRSHHFIERILLFPVVLTFFLIMIVPMDAFQILSTRNCQHRSHTHHDTFIALRASNNNDDDNVFTQQQQQSPRKKVEYSRELQLREEAESPFRKVRFFFYISLGAGAFISLGVSAARVAAAVFAQINVDLLPESTQNVIIDSVGLVVLTLLYQNDLKAQNSKLKRAAKGSDLAKLKIRASKQIIQSFQNSENTNENDFTENETTTSSTTSTTATKSTTTTTFVTNLASLRTGRGIDKRVIIVAGGKQKIQQVIQEVMNEYNDDMILNDLLLVPIVLPQCIAPDITTMMFNTTNTVSTSLPPSIALPVTSSSSSTSKDVDSAATVTTWNDLMNDEATDAKEQGIDIINDGFCIILKKNGRVGQRTKGINLRNMVGEVTARRDAGMDVKNI